MRAIIGLGSNIQPERNIPLAARLLGRCEGWTLLAVSPTYRGPAVGTDGPEFHNAAALVETSLDHDEVRQRLRGSRTGWVVSARRTSSLRDRSTWT